MAQVSSSRSLVRTATPPRVATRTYVVPMTPAEALERLRLPDLPFVDAGRAQRAKVSGRFVVAEPDAFTLYAAWGPRVSSTGLEEVAIGPAVRGRIEACARGCRITVSQAPYAVTPARRAAVAAWLAGLGTVAMISTVLAGFSALTAGIAFGIVALFLYGVFVANGRRRRDELNDLLALIEGRFSPLELGPESAPLRRGG